MVQIRPVALLPLVVVLFSCRPTPEPVWWKGNTHTHTLWSDGNGAPELVADWYREHGYDFLVLSDHNILSEGEAWFPVVDDSASRLTPERVEELRRRFGQDWVEVREQDSLAEMRLKTLPELRSRFEEPGVFLFIQGEEISDGFDGHPIHVNGLNLEEVIPPQGGQSLQEVLQRNVDAVIEQGRRLGRPTLAHINHPNFQWALTPEQVAAVEGERFFEVYNGHSGVRNYGDETHPDTETLWDIALTLRLTELDLGVLYGLATDDSHEYFRTGVGNTNPGRGWVMVNAPELTADAIIDAMQRGDFYATSGVRIRDFRTDDAGYEVAIESEPGVSYRTLFIGTRLVDGRPGKVGEILGESPDSPARYDLKGDEVYVRAKVISSRLHPNPYAAGDYETAWLQPLVPGE